jgi:hypothetical protein
LRIEPFDSEITHVAYASSASVVAIVTASGECHLWDGSGRPGGLYLPAQWPGGIALSADGKRIALCDDSGAIYIRSTENGRRLSPYPLQTYLRPYAHRIREDDPVRLALHWAHPNQPMNSAARWPPHQELATIETLVFHLTDADGVEHEMSPANVVWRDRNHYARPLYHSPTLLLELKDDRLEVLQNGPVARWGTLRKPEFRKPGRYKLWIEGVIRLNEDVDIPFKSGEIGWEIVKSGIVPMAELVKIAESKLRAVLPPSIEKRIQAPLPELGGHTVVDDRAGNRLVRFSHSVKFGYERYEVVCSPNGDVLTVSSDRVTTCVAVGTMIDTPSGTVPVDSLETGMQLWGFDLAAGKKTPVRVISVRKHQSDSTLQFGALRVSPWHPIFADGKWRIAGGLRGGESVIGSDGKAKRLPAPDLVPGSVVVYDIAVDGPRNYFAGGLLVHNKSRDYSPDLDDPWYSLWPQRRADQKQVWPTAENAEQSKDE